MKKIKKYLILLYAGAIISVQAQDFHLSMYDAAPIYLNPAMTGLIDTKMRAHAQFRNQWNVLAYKPFTTSLVSFDMPSGKWGFGGQISEMRAGAGNYNVLQMLASAAYAIPVDKNKYHNLSLGLQAGVTQKRIEYQVLTFDSQWTNANGGSFDKSTASGENFSGNTQFQPAVNFGALYFYGKQQSRFNPFAGFSAFNLTTPKESFLNGDNTLARRYYYHAGVRINVSEILYIIPKVLIYAQAKIVQQTYALDAGYYFKGEKFFALAGYNFRVNDASIIYAGLKKDNYIFKLAYDFNVSTLRGVSKTRGAYEISLTWMGKKARNTETKNCPRL
jgi:type IX secretion system PorP/SprF family membrane protein